jgi:hypothetical protein
VEARDSKADRSSVPGAGTANRPVASLRDHGAHVAALSPNGRSLPAYEAPGRIVPGPVTRPVLPRAGASPAPRYPSLPAPRAGFGLPSLRRNVCPHFYMTGCRGAIPIQAPHLLKALIRQDQNVSRCQLRGGVHLEQGYVNDVCLTPRFNQCVFYEDDLTKD